LLINYYLHVLFVATTNMTGTWFQPHTPISGDTPHSHAMAIFVEVYRTNWLSFWLIDCKENCGTAGKSSVVSGSEAQSYRLKLRSRTGRHQQGTVCIT
jgi:hypothetical protein